MHTSTGSYRPLNHERDKVRELVPQFLRDTSANLISFMEEYYDYLNRDGFASYELAHIIDENDIDVTSEKYLDAIQGEIAKVVPNSNVIDRNTLYKRIVHYYRIKGTPESVSAFFQLMFDSAVDVYYPGDNLLKLSAGTYDSTSASYTANGGFLSGLDKIQDSDFWQDFSYRINTDIELSKWENAFRRLAHPAGMKFFAMIAITAIVKSRWDKVEKYEGTDTDPEGWLESIRPPRLRGVYSSEGSHTPKYQPGWLSATIAEAIHGFANNYYANPSDPNPTGSTSLVRHVRLNTSFTLPASNWSNSINAEHYFRRGFWDDPVTLNKLNVFEMPLSTLINDYQQEYAVNRLEAEEAPQPAVQVSPLVLSFLEEVGYYFFQSSALAAGPVATWDSSVSSSSASLDLVGAQTTGPDQPAADGTLVTFADNTDHLDIPSTTQAGWQVAGTSLGTFAYKVNANAVTELNLLGNLGNAAYRQVGQSYGTILLPETATGADVEETRQALIARGAADGATSSSLYLYWIYRSDIVEFKSVEMSNATNISYAWYGCSNLSNFGAIQAPLCVNFLSAWQNCSALTSFSSGAQLGTAATNVNFQMAFFASGLTQIPAGLDLSKGNAFTQTFRNCSSLTTIGSGVLLGTASTGVSFASTFQNSGLTEIPANLDLSKGDYFQSSFYDCTALTTIGSGVLFGTASSNVNFNYTWKNCTNLVTLPADFNLSAGTNFRNAFQSCTSLVDFPAGVFDTMGVPASNCFSHTWTGCTALSTTSVENILSSIDTSGQSSPSGGGQYIIIDYNVSTGALTAATNTAVASLKSNGWIILVNNVTL